MFNLKVANQIIFEEKDVSLKFMNKILIHIIMGYILDNWCNLVRENTVHCMIPMVIAP